MSNTLTRLSATELASLLRAKRVSAREVVEAHLRQVEAVNPIVNAVVTLDPDGALQRAAHLDNEAAHGRFLGPLHGLPIAHKDLLDTAGMRTTYGSPIFEDHVPREDAEIVQRLRAGGAISIGKTNTPEFGAGSQTFNPVFGATKNPYDLTKTCGGSSGGAAAALACGMIPIADGTDTGGSLRNPASFCSVVGLRPSVLRAPREGWFSDWNELTVSGPMARTCADLAAVFQCLSGRSRESFGSDIASPRIAWATGLAGIPFDAAVRDVCNAQRATFEALGYATEEAWPDMSGADESFRVLRALGFYRQYGSAVLANPGKVKQTVLDEVERGAKLTAADEAAAVQRRDKLRLRFHDFMLHEYGFLVLPTAQVPPFPVDQPYVTEVAGLRMDSYIDWMRSCYYITVTGHPALSVPAGFTPDGLPVGLQIVGGGDSDWSVLDLGTEFENARGPLPPPRILAS
jgi:amidase